MELNTAQKLATDLMAQHGLTGWSFSWLSSKKRFGQCSYGPKLVSLSRDLVALNTVERVTNTILHEIAHALLPSHVGHKPEWVRMARSIGCDGKRCYDVSETVTPRMPVTGTCPTCKRTVGKTRIPRRALACSICCKAGRRGFDARHAFTWEHTTSKTVFGTVKPFVAPTALVTPALRVPAMPVVRPGFTPVYRAPAPYYTPFISTNLFSSSARTDAPSFPATKAPTKYALWKARKLAKAAR
jgi:hypothetical protein